MLGIRGDLAPGPELDAALAALHERHLLAPGPIERIVLLAYDAYHDDAGRRPPLPESDEVRGSDMYTSNSLVAELCRRHPQRYLFGASVHPYRADACACVEEVAAAGASLLKWLPLNQNIDIADRRTVAVLKTCARLGLPVLAHYNSEFTLSTQHAEFQSLRPVLEVLRSLRRNGEMPPFIFAHAATPVSALEDDSEHELLLDALNGEFAEAPVYADISAFTAPGKVGFARRLAARQELHHKLLFGSDFPVPIGMFRLRGDLRRHTAEIAAEPSWPQRAVSIFRCMGFNEVVFHQAEFVLRGLDCAGARRGVLAGRA